MSVPFLFLFAGKFIYQPEQILHFLTLFPPSIRARIRTCTKTVPQVR